MSRRNSRLEKQVRRLEHSLRDEIDARIDLIDYLLIRKLAKSKKEARQMCLDGRVKVASHVVGRLGPVKTIKGEEYILYPFVPASARGEIMVLSA